MILILFACGDRQPNDLRISAFAFMKIKPNHELLAQSKIGP
jgi:hypothetical protein